MKKFLVPALSLVMVLSWSCQSDDLSDVTPANDNKQQVDPSNSGMLKNCASHSVLEREIQENPNRAHKLLEIEQQTNAFVAASEAEHIKGGATTTMASINIPVIVHVLYNTTQQNISSSQIQSQINVLTADYTARNSELGAGKVPAEFSGRVANVDISFSLAQVTRKYSSRTSWGTNNDMKYSSRGGVDAIQPTKYLNIWICNIGGGTLGYAQFPGGATATDGVVISPQYFGTTGYVSAPFNKGRTGTHEVGHWLNLRHIWGDGGCSVDDYVSDTPVADRANYGCPAYPTVHCSSNDMTMNYMDYTDDACMYMFSTGQRNRMRALFASGGARRSFVL